MTCVLLSKKIYFLHLLVQEDSGTYILYICVYFEIYVIFKKSFETLSLYVVSTDTV